MLAGKFVLAVIPARSGSKRLPGKNIKPLCGKPLINWSVDAALGSHFIDCVAVSSDDQAVLRVVDNPAVRLVKRPSVLAEDATSSIDVALHSTSCLPSFDIMVWLQPTSPLRTRKNIDEALQLLVEKEGAKSVVSVKGVVGESNPKFPICVSSEGKVFCNKRSTKCGMPHARKYALNGAIYAIYRSSLMEFRSFTPPDTYVYEMSENSSIDIDTLDEFSAAEQVLLRSLRK